MSNRCYVAFWTVAGALLIAAARWLLHDFADYLCVCEQDTMTVDDLLDDMGLSGPG